MRKMTKKICKMSSYTLCKSRIQRSCSKGSNYFWLLNYSFFVYDSMYDHLPWKTSALHTHTHTYTHTHKHMPLVFSHKKTNIILELRKYLLNKGLNLFRVCVLFYFVLRKLRQYKWNYNFCVLTISLHPFF
jgi:hypothetical protein